MTVPVVEAGFTSNTATAVDEITLTKPAGVVSGDLLIIICANDNNTDTDQWNDSTNKPTGFTLIAEFGSSANDCHCAAFYRVSDGGESATIVAPNQSNADNCGFYIRVTGAHATPMDVTGTEYNGSGTSHAIPSINTGTDDALCFYVFGFDGGDGLPNSVAGTGWVEKDEVQEENTGPSSSASWGVRDLASQGASGNATVTSAVDDGGSGFQFSIAPATVGGGGRTMGSIAGQGGLAGTGGIAGEGGGIAA